MTRRGGVARQERCPFAPFASLLQIRAAGMGEDFCQLQGEIP